MMVNVGIKRQVIYGNKRLDTRDEMGVIVEKGERLKGRG